LSTGLETHLPGQTSHNEMLTIFAGKGFAYPILEISHKQCQGSDC